MRYLDRAVVAAPACLSNYSPGNAWADLSCNHDDYGQVVDTLNGLQANHCAYCECDLSNEGTNPHVDHFEQRSRTPAKTFEWANLFRSCSHHECCAKHKDRLASTYAPGALLKPDVDNPRQYIEFDTQGRVAPRRELSDTERQRADVTIRVFNLMASRLVNSRLAYLAGPRAVLDATLNTLTDDSSASACIDSIAADYRASAFSAAILDLFGVGP
jgi:uncharacterized protein (TIGR02646 family)